MQYRRLGKTELNVSSVGLGTNQLRLLPESYAIDTLVAGFRAGVNLVHVSSDYEGAEKLVAKAMQEHNGTVYPAINSYDVHGSHDSKATGFEKNFENSCEIFDTEYLPLYGVAAMEDREAMRENVWGKNGIIDFLEKAKADKRIGHTFCTSHGSPEYIKKLINTGVFDAIMLSYNPLGFHLLSQNLKGPRKFESIPHNSYDIFPLCKENDIGVMVMMPLAGGLLVQEKGFPSTNSNYDKESINADIILKKILQDNNISSVIPGVSSPEEAIENASAGDVRVLSNKNETSLASVIDKVKSSVCSRCGACEPTCSEKLPVSWLFRAAEMAEHPAEFFETWRDVEYFELNPSFELACANCKYVSCRCPYDIDIPNSLMSNHSRMLTLMESVKIPPPQDDYRANRGSREFGAKVLRIDISENLKREIYSCRVQLENTGKHEWHTSDVKLVVTIKDQVISESFPRQTAYFRDRVIFSLEIKHNLWNSLTDIKLCLTSINLNTTPMNLFSGNLASLNHYHNKRTNEPMIFKTLKNQAKNQYSVEWLEHNFPSSWLEGSRVQIYLKIRNSGTRTWSKTGQPESGVGPVNVVVDIDNTSVAWSQFTHDIEPDQEAIVGITLFMPEGNSSWDIEVSLVEQGIAYFSKKGVKPLSVTIARERWDHSPDHEALASMLRLNPAFHLPSEGIPRSRDGRAFPLISNRAAGDTIWDHAGNHWIDYAMGWGSALLGHANPEINKALQLSLDSSSITNLPHASEAQVSESLCKLIPSAEMVLFGKNGSDVCTAAIRVATVFTGKSKILFSGFHGWKDPFAQAFEPALAHLGENNLIRFKNNDLNGFASLLKEHADELAAVIIEPAAQVEGVDGPVRDTDPEFLASATKMAKKKGIIVIFDEIFTGFRYKKGSVQAATGVKPNLSCFGKGMSGGMPLAALVGEARLLSPTLSKIFYHPTYKGEAYSFVATKAALDFYRHNDVPRSIEKYGIELMQRINQLSKVLKVNGKMTGLPFRMVYKFEEQDPTLLAFKRTLLQQELLLNGIITFRGFMIPSFAHGKPSLERTIDAFDKSLKSVLETSNKNNWVNVLELPLVL